MKEGVRHIESIIVNDTPVLRLIHPLTLSIELKKVKIKLNARAAALCNTFCSLFLESGLATLPRLRHNQHIINEHFIRISRIQNSIDSFLSHFHSSDTSRAHLVKND